MNFATNHNMTPYAGPWTRAEAAHLLRRCLFCPTFAQITQSETDGLDATITSLFTVTPLDQPLSYHADEAVAAVGTTWINSPYPATDAGDTDRARKRSLHAWLIKNFINDNQSIAQRMMLFWHNHFSVTETNDARADYQYYKLLYDYSLGNFKDFIIEMTIDPAMLIFLNGDGSLGVSPNENYARELLELYTIGKGPQIAPGNYTNYTDDDVTESARILTGYSVDGMRSTTPTPPSAIFNLADHDNATKTLSAQLGSAVIPGNGATEYVDYINVIFAQPEAVTFFCTELYRFFVSEQVTSDVKSLVIPEMVATFIGSGFEIQPVMEQLLKSEHFYDLALRGGLLKSPLDFRMSMILGSNSSVAFDFDTDSQIHWKMADHLADYTEMDFPNPPSVVGYDAYRLDPELSRLWVTTVSYDQRVKYVESYINGSGFSANGNNFKIDFLGLLESLPALDRPDPNLVIDHLYSIFCPKDHAGNKLILKNLLTDSLPDFEWTDLYGSYEASPSDPILKGEVTERIRLVLVQLFNFSAFYTF